MFLMVSLFLLFFIIVLVIFLQFNTFRKELNSRLKETQEALSKTHQTVGERLDNATQLFSGLATSLGKLDEANRRILEVGKDISSLQELLRAPKFRGEIGETLLGNLLSEVLPEGCYQLPYQFKNGDTVDAIIRIGENLVPIDAKFPLENFQRMITATSDEEKKSYRKRFLSDVKNRVDEIAKKYILPDEGTYGFALMYIPAENVYYEMTIGEDFLNYALSKKVILVSPNTFYAYLQVICLGMKGLKIEHNAREILANLGRLEIDLKKFREDFELVGQHLTNALTKYSEAERKLDRFADKLMHSQDTKQIP